MNRDDQERKHFIEAQLEWIQKRDAILVEIEEKLHDMKRIAEYARDQVLSSSELNRLNRQLYDLQQEVDLLDKQLHSVEH